MSIRIVLRLTSGDVPSPEFLEVGEPVWDPTGRRIGVGNGGASPYWYPKLDPSGNFILYSGQQLAGTGGIINMQLDSSGVEFIQGTTNLVTIGSATMSLLNSTTLTMTDGSGTAVLTRLDVSRLNSIITNIKVLLTNMIADTATPTDVDNLFT